MKRVIRSDKPVTLLLLSWSHKCDFGAEPKSRIIATSAVKGLNAQEVNFHNYNNTHIVHNTRICLVTLLIQVQACLGFFP
jgi:hypothetical protein